MSELNLSRHSRAMLLNVLWHHQGGSSPVGQPIRKMLGIGQHDHMTDEQVSEAKWIDSLLAAPPVPEGWRLVPKDPTEEMRRAFKGATVNFDDLTTNAYRVMLAAAPKP